LKSRKPKPEEKPKAKVKAVKETPGSTFVDDSPIDFSDFADQALGLFVPTVENEALISARTYIPMASEFSSILTPKGLPCGHVSHMAGDSDTGKTTFAVYSAIQTQSIGGFVLYGLTEIKFDLNRAMAMGLDREKIVFYKPGTLEKLFEKGKEAITKFRAKHPDKPVLWIWDSISATPSEYEMDDKTANHNMKAANAISGELRRIRAFLDTEEVHLMMINRIYQKQTKTSFEKQTSTYGGKAPKGFSTIQLEFSQIKKLIVKRKIDGDDVSLKVGMISKIENTKNHLAKPFGSIELPIDKVGFVLGERKVVIE
jgi:RecA/RadA recombinase